MSYEIIYGKQFIKLQSTGEVIPMILTGSNNCYEIAPGGGNGRRERSWTNLHYYNEGTNLSVKPEVLLANLDTELAKRIKSAAESPYADKGDTPENVKAHFGYYEGLAVGGGSCSDTSWGKRRNVFANGIKGAKTIEELDALGINPYFNHYPRENDGAPGYQGLHSEQEYFIELEKWLAWQNLGEHRSFSLSFSPMDTDRVLERLRAAVPPKEPTPKVCIGQNYYFVLSNDQGSLIRYTSRGYKYSYDGFSAKQYRTEEEAEAYRQNLIKKGKYRADTWKVEKIMRPTTFEVSAKEAANEKFHKKQCFKMEGGKLRTWNYNTKMSQKKRTGGELCQNAQNAVKK
ncbi:MAG: hypothetical protein V1767_00705 [Chloroflexota bacterium]